MENTSALRGVGILVTRPAHQSEALCKAVVAAGGFVVALPTIDIVAIADVAKRPAWLDHLSECDIAIFISVNAVRFGVDAAGGDGPWPKHIRIGAIGKSTAEALSGRGLEVHVLPRSEWNSEGLLNEPELKDVTNKRIIIFRGAGGRELIADTLRQRGAEVEYAEVYRRAVPNYALRERISAQEKNKINIVVATSNEGLANLVTLAGEEDRDWLLSRNLVVVSDRGAELARQLGFTTPAWISDQAADSAIVQTLCQWQKQQIESREKP